MQNKEEIFNKIYTDYKEKLSNLNVSNSKFLIAFAATPGSGITTLSKSLEASLEAVRISSDEVQSILQEYRGEEFYDGFILEKREFIYYLVKKIINEYENKLIILDKSIDRSYEDIKNLTDELDIPFVTISLETGREELVKRLKNTYGDYAKNYINDLDRWIREHEEFKKRYNYDMLFDTEKESVQQITEKITEKIKP